MRLISIVLAAGLIAAATFPARAQDASVPAPDAPAVAPEGQPTVATMEECSVYFGADGEKEMTTLHPLKLADGAKFALPADAPPGVKVVACRRDAIVPSKNDFKVIQAGFAFAIISGGRVVTLEVVEGRPKMRLVQGALTDQEKALINEFFIGVQEKMGGKPKAK